MIRLAFAFLLSLCVSAQAQMSGGVGGFPGPGTAHSSATFVGAGDVFTTSPYAAYSCARVFTAAQASTATSLCDLNAITGGAAVCTLRGSASGFVDQSAYCPGSLTPAAACAAASGGSCNISQMYDLTGNSRHIVQATNANRPGIVFSSTPTGTLPAVDCTVGTNAVLNTSSTFTQAQPLTFSAVYIRTSGTATGGVIGANASLSTGSATGANLAQVSSDNTTFLTAAAIDSAWHALNSMMNGASSAINIDGSDSTGNANTIGFSANNIRVCRAATNQLSGRIAEAYMWSTSTTSTDRGNLNSNQRSASGYGSF